MAEVSHSQSRLMLSIVSSPSATRPIAAPSLSQPPSWSSRMSPIASRPSITLRSIGVIASVMCSVSSPRSSPVSRPRAAVVALHSSYASTSPRAACAEASWARARRSVDSASMTIMVAESPKPAPSRPWMTTSVLTPASSRSRTAAATSARSPWS